MFLKLALIVVLFTGFYIETVSAQPVYISPSQRQNNSAGDSQAGSEAPAEPQALPPRQGGRVILSPTKRATKKMPEIRKQAAMDRARLQALNEEALRGREELRLSIAAIFDQTKNIDSSLLQGRPPQSVEDLEQLYFVNTTGLRVETVKSQYENMRRQLEFEAMLIAGSQEDARTQHLKNVARKNAASNAEFIEFGEIKMPRRIFEMIRRQP